MNHEILAVLEYIEQERGISKEQLASALEKALASTCQKNLEHKPKTVEVKLDRATGSIRVMVVYNVVETIEPEKAGEQITLEEARKTNPSAQIGDQIRIEVVPRDFGRVVAQAARQAMMQEIRKAERVTIENEFRDQVGEIVSGTVRRYDKGDIYVDLQKAEAVIPAKEKVPSEQYMPGDRINALLLKVSTKEGEAGLVLSRASRGFIKKLFEREVSEIHDGIVEIVSIAREAGSRTKIAVRSNDPRVDPVGACVGMRGMRVKNITSELNGERVDIIPFSEDLPRYVSNALHPAKAEKIEVDYETAKIHFYVDSENSRLAFGKKAQNIRLAQKLIGGDWKIELNLVEENEAADDTADFEEQKLQRTEALSAALGVPVETAALLVSNGFLTVEGLSELSEDDLRNIQGLSEEDAETILDKIAEAGLN